MSREVLFFTEMGYTEYPQDQAKKLGYNNLMFPNEFFSPEKLRNFTRCISRSSNIAPSPVLTAS